MSTLSAKDRVSLCMFSFADGRRCRTPRLRNHPHFCYYHAEKEARARAAQSLGTDLARYFSGNYLSACDLSTALGCLIPAVVRGDVKPRTARTVAYMAQTLLQSIHISQDEYCEAFGPDTWRKSIRTSVNSNHRYRFPPPRSGGLHAGAAPQPQHPSNAQPKPQPSAPTSPACHPERSEGSQPIPATQHPPVAHPACPEATRRVRPEASHSSSHPQRQPAEATVNCHCTRPDLVGERSQESASSSNSSLATHHSFTPSEGEGPLPQPLPPTAAEFAQQVLAGRNLSHPGREPGSLPPTPHVQPAPPNSQATETSVGCHSERSEESAFSSSPSSSPVCHPERSEGSHPTPASQPVPPTAPPAQPVNSPNLRSSTSPREPNRDAPWLHFGDSRHIRPDSKLL